MAEKFEGKFECLGENTEQFIPKEITKTDKDDNGKI